MFYHYLTLKPEQSNTFFRLMDQRYGRASTLITTNLEPSAWYELFANKALVDALLDRLQHRCITIRIDGPSLRSNEFFQHNGALHVLTITPTLAGCKMD